MRIIILMSFVCASGLSATAQTLQTVTANGRTTDQWLQITGAGNVLTTGAGLELYGSNANGNGYVKAYNRATGVGTTLKIQDTGGGNTLMNEGGGNVGIGVTAPTAKLHVNNVQPAGASTMIAKFTQANVPEADGFLMISNATTSTGMFIPNLRARSSSPGRPFGFYLTGEAEDVTPSAGDAVFAAVVVDGRSNTGTRLNNNNVLAVNSMGQNLVMVKGDGSVGINAMDTKGYKLAVGGSMIAERVKVKLQGNWPDYVFSDTYQLPSLAEVAIYVKAHKHLPDMPAAEDVQKEGQDVGEMNKQLLKKVEELTLYLIQQQHANETIQLKMKKLEEEVEQLKRNK